MFDLSQLGYVRIAAAVPRVHVANPRENSREILSMIKQAEEAGAKAIVFPELCMTGYTCADLFHQRLLLEKTLAELNILLEAMKEQEIDILAAVGMPIEADNQLFNCAVVIKQGQILGVVPKVFIPNYNEFYEKRWFSPAAGRLSDTITICSQEVPFGENLLFKDSNSGLCLGVEICEDLWVPCPPSSMHVLNGANLILNLSASNEVVGKNEYRKALVCQQSARCLSAYAYASAGPGESTTDVVFGGQVMLAENGSILEEKRFEENIIIYADVDIEKLMNERKKINTLMNCKPAQNYRIISFASSRELSINPFSFKGLQIKVDPYPFVPGKKDERDIRCRDIFQIQSTGLTQRLLKTGIDKVLIGISGGLDSTLALLVCCEAFQNLGYPLDQIIGITMPGFGTSGRTKNNADALMKELGIYMMEIPITNACLQHFSDIGHDPGELDTTYENVQARERTQILMDLANKKNGLVVGTGDLSELALGWATYNGDHMSHYAVNAGVPKTLVKYLVAWYADTAKNPAVNRILHDILDTPISPELLPPDDNDCIKQKTEDVIGPYALHDFFLYHMMRWGFPPIKIYFLASKAFQNRYSEQEIIKWMKVFYRRFFTQQFKRSCLPDGPKVGSICLSPRGDWRMPSDASADIWLKELEMLEEKL